MKEPVKYRVLFHGLNPKTMQFVSKTFEVTARTTREGLEILTQRHPELRKDYRGRSYGFEVIK